MNLWTVSTILEFCSRDRVGLSSNIVFVLGITGNCKIVMVISIREEITVLHPFIKYH